MPSPWLTALTLFSPFLASSMSILNNQGSTCGLSTTWVHRVLGLIDPACRLRSGVVAPRRNLMQLLFMGLGYRKYICQCKAKKESDMKKYMTKKHTKNRTFKELKTLQAGRFLGRMRLSGKDKQPHRR